MPRATLVAMAFSDTSFFEVPILNQIIAGNIDLDEIPIDIEISNGTKFHFLLKYLF